MKPVRVVITGLGAISPLGSNVEEMWSGLCAGQSGIGPITAFDPTGLPCNVAGQVPEYRISKHVPRSHRKAVKLMCRDIELAVIAAREAVVSSGLVTKGIDPDQINVDPTRMAIDLGAAMISCEFPELGPGVAASTTDGKFDIRKWGSEGLRHVTPLWLLKYLPNMLACHVGIIHDIRGPSNTLTCAEASAHLALGEAAQIIARRDSDIALAGGVEAKVNFLIMIRQVLLGRTAPRCEDTPERVSRPFDAGACGAVFGEAGGIVVLESLETARQRGADILAEVIGIGQSHSLHPVYDRLEPDGKGLQVAIEKALADAQIEPKQLDLIIPHGTGVPEDDLAEARAIEAALGAAVRNVPVWPTKSMLATTGAAAGALDVIAAVKAMRDDLIPAAQNFERPADGCRLDISAQSRRRKIDHALCCSYTHGGQTAAVVLKRFEKGAA